MTVQLKQYIYIGRRLSTYKSLVQVLIVHYNDDNAFESVDTGCIAVV